MAIYGVRAFNFALYGDGASTQANINMCPVLAAANPAVPWAGLLEVYYTPNGVITPLISTYENGILSVTLPFAPTAWSASGSSYILITAVFSY